MASDGKDDKKQVIIIAARERGPGPGRYALPSTTGYQKHDYTKYMNPAHSLAKRIGDACETYQVNSSPGPIYFINPRITKHGMDGTPTYSCLGRQKEQKVFMTPSPGKYSPEKVHPQGERNAPVPSMSYRTRYRKRDNNPAPNRYCLPPLIGSHQPNRLSAPSHSMTGRSGVGSYAEDLSGTPGPGQYNATEPNYIRKRQPQYSLQGRSFLPGDNTKKPGPGAYSPEKVTLNKPSPAQHSLGIRHSEFVCPLLIM